MPRSCHQTRCAVLPGSAPCSLCCQRRRTRCFSFRVVCAGRRMYVHRDCAECSEPRPSSIHLDAVAEPGSFWIILYLAQRSSNPLGTSLCSHISDMNTMSRLITYNRWCNSLSLLSMLRALSKQQLRLTAAARVPLLSFDRGTVPKRWCSVRMWAGMRGGPLWSRQCSWWRSRRACYMPEDMIHIVLLAGLLL